MDLNTVLGTVKTWMTDNPSRGGYQVREVGESIMITKKEYVRRICNGQKCLGEE